jgi:hypothetical protein
MAAANQRDEESVIATTESVIATADWTPQIPRRNDWNNPDPILRNRTVDMAAYLRRKGSFRTLDYTLEDDIESIKTQPSFADAWTSFKNEVASIATNPSLSSALSDTSFTDFTIDDVDDSSTLSGSTLSESDIYTYYGSYDDHNQDIFDDHELWRDLVQLFDIATIPFLKITNAVKNGLMF